MNFLLIPAFAILNRWRGSDWPRPWAPFIAKVLCGVILGYLYGGQWWAYPLMFGLYWFGENWGWGSWIGAILEDRYTPKDLYMLSLRGLLWWGLIGVAFAIKSQSYILTGMALIVVSLAFPFSFILATLLPKKTTTKNSYTEVWWMYGEIIYGAFQGFFVWCII